MQTIGPILVVLSIPLALRWVPRNPLYGFRVPATLRDDQIWYEVNAGSARQFGLLGALMVALGFILPLGVRTWTLAAIAVVGLGVITLANWRWANRLARERGV